MKETMDVFISLSNDAAVSVFGALLSASFCDCLRSRRSRQIFWGGMALLLLVQGVAYLFCGAQFRLKVYPLIFHLPLAYLLHVLTRKWLWPVVSILSAYLFCQIRRWLALLAVAVLSGGENMQKLVELIVTVPLLLFLMRFICPAIRQMMDYPVKIQCYFSLIPALYYAFDYLTRIYTELLSSGEPVVLEFMPFICCLSYMLFLAYNSAEERERQWQKQIQSNLDLQLSQAIREIGVLRESQTMAIQYRHDLRHHLQYVSNCIANDQKERAQSYIASVCGEIEAQQVWRWCENEAANLVLSSFAGRAKKTGVKMNVEGTLPAAFKVSDNDLCVLLSNSLENALHACQPLAEAGKTCTIELQFRFDEKADKFFLQMTNPCKEPVKFEKGRPVSNRSGHGIGVQSICAIVEQYGGDCQFLVKEGQFVLRMFL